MLVDELFIPHRSGTIRVPLDQRVTVFAGLDRDARTRMAGMLVSGLAGVGPASVRVRDALGRPAVISSSGSRQADGTAIDGPVPTLAPDADELGRCMVVHASDLGLGEERPDPAMVADRLATEKALNSLVSELAEVTAGVTERIRLTGELDAIARIPLGLDPVRSPGPDGVHGDGSTNGHRSVDVTALKNAAPNVDRLILRRHAADELLLHSATALRAMAFDGEIDHHVSGAMGDDLGTGLLAAVEAYRRAEQRRTAIAALPAEERDAQAEAEITSACEDARTILRRAADRLEGRRAEARADLDECDDALLAIALTSGVTVGPEGPAEALTTALRGTTLDPIGEGDTRVHRPSTRLDAESRTRALVERRARLLRSKLAGLPTEADLAGARERVTIAEGRLAMLDAKLGTPEPAVLAQVRNVLLARATALRPDGLDCAVPLVLDDPLVQLDPTSHHGLLDVLARVAQRTQIIILTEDRVATSWARHRAERGEVRLVDLKG